MTSIRISSPGFDAKDVSKAIGGILASTRLLSLGSVDTLGQPWVNHSYFSYDQEFNLFVLTPPSTLHAQYLAKSGTSAIAIADSQQTGDAGKQGIQATGRWSQAEGALLDTGLATYRERFPGTRDVLRSLDTMIESGMVSRLFAIRLKDIKVFDEQQFGWEVWVAASVVRS